MTTTTAYDRLIDALTDYGVNVHGNRATSRCPAHDDTKPSLTFSRGDERALVDCKAGCATKDVIAALNWRMADLFDQPRRNGNKPHVAATYDYVDEHGALLYQAVRMTPKDFRQRRPDGNGGWLWNLGNTRRVLYRLPDVINAVKNGTTIYVTEG